MESKVNSAPDWALKAFWLYCASSVNGLFFSFKLSKSLENARGGLPDKSDGDAPSLT